MGVLVGVMVGPRGRNVGETVILLSSPSFSSYSTGCSEVRSSEYTKGVGMVVVRGVIPSWIELLNVGKGVIPGNTVGRSVPTKCPMTFIACCILSF